MVREPLEKRRTRRPRPSRSRRDPRRTGARPVPGARRYSSCTSQPEERAHRGVREQRDSTPPASTTCRRAPAQADTRRAASAIADAPDAQAALDTVRHGPSTPNRNDRCAATELNITRGTVTGLMARTPLVEQPDELLGVGHSRHPAAGTADDRPPVPGGGSRPLHSLPNRVVRRTERQCVGPVESPDLDRQQVVDRVEAGHRAEQHVGTRWQPVVGGRFWRHSDQHTATPRARRLYLFCGRCLSTSTDKSGLFDVAGCAMMSDASRRAAGS